MTDLILETSENPKVVLEAQKRLTVQGWDKPEIQIKANQEEAAQSSSENEVFTIQTTEDAVVSVPHEASVTIQVSLKDLVIKGVHGSVNIVHAAGSIVLKDVGPTQIDMVEGSLTTKQVNGDVRVRQCSGMLNAAGISGDFSAELVSGHLNLKQVHGNTSAEVSGNANLKLAPSAGTNTQVTAHGVMTCKVSDDLDAAVSIKGHGPVVINVGGTTKRAAGGEIELVFGSGAAEINLTGHGPVSLFGGASATNGESDTEHDFDLSGLGADIGNMAEDIISQVNVQLESQMSFLNEQLKQLENLRDMPGISPEKAERIARKAQERAEKAREKIQMASERAQERMARKIAAAQRRANKQAERAVRHGRSINFSFGGKTDRPDPVSEQERMIILQMLADKKISAEEADQLLAALGGE